ncbi:MAG: hypothetical protein GXP53_07720 [Deltaproteobacteria bacterium]|nr:hypothetical protein [Deltaproteobacteria bacterium]
MKLSRGKVIASLAANDSLDPVKILQNLSQQPLPGNIVNELKAWSGHAETFILYESFGLLEGKTAAKYAKDCIVEKAGQDVYIIRSPQKVYRQLETALQVPLLINHPESRLKSPDKGAKSVFCKAGALKKSTKQPKKKINVRRTVAVNNVERPVDICTHTNINRKYCGTPVETGPGYSLVELETFSGMAVDDSGLVHGGFVFGLADYAAMVAVNHPNVVLGSAEVKFLKPVSVGSRLVARARVDGEPGRKNKVLVTVSCEEVPVFEGSFSCPVLERHVLA